jgi:transposase
MSYRIAGIDVHKKMVAVVIADIAERSELVLARRQFPATPDQLRALAQWLIDEHVQEAVMESTAQYWKPVWGALECYWRPACQSREGAGAMAGKLYLAQAQSNRARRGRKSDFADAERLVKRLLAQELVISFVPDVEQRLWRTVMRKKYQLTCQLVQAKNQLEAFLEEAHIKLSSVVSDLLGTSARRMLHAIAEGATDVDALAALAHQTLRATPEQLCDALGACRGMHPVYRDLLQCTLAQITLLETQIDQMDRTGAALLSGHQDAVRRLAEVPGLGLSSSLQLIAEIGPAAATFPSARQLCSWAGMCPGVEESAGKSTSSRSPKGNRQVRRLLNQAAQSAVKVKGSIFDIVFRRLSPRLGYKQAIWAVAHRLCRLLWIILHRGDRYEERGPAVSIESKQSRVWRMVRDLRKLGYRVDGPLSAMPA